MKTAIKLKHIPELSYISGNTTVTFTDLLQITYDGPAFKENRPMDCFICKQIINFLVETNPEQVIFGYQHYQMQLNPTINCIYLPRWSDAGKVKQKVTWDTRLNNSDIICIKFDDQGAMYQNMPYIDKFSEITCLNTSSQITKNGPQIAFCSKDLLAPTISFPSICNNALSSNIELEVNISPPPAKETPVKTSPLHQSLNKIIGPLKNRFQSFS